MQFHNKSFSPGIYVHFLIIDANKGCIYGHDNGQIFRVFKQSHVIASHDSPCLLFLKG